MLGLRQIWRAFGATVDEKENSMNVTTCLAETYVALRARRTAFVLLAQVLVVATGQWMPAYASAAPSGVGGATIAKAFSPATIPSGATSTITLTLTNGNGIILTNAAFTDALTNMTISGAQAAGGTCAGAGTNNFANNATSLAFSGMSLAASSSCTVTVLVTSSTLGANPNSTSGVTTTQSGTGVGSNVATLTVTTMPVELQSFGVH